MQLWQLVLLGFLVVVPAALMVDYWGDQRHSFRGRPSRRAWRPSPRPLPDPDEHH